ncbi:hypothetical protein LTR53_012849 [Teratosphaeriaceae sp. CCFEE 6253]|nr:hypothetical protein LTR53_012849 [Teratosphaeriaceae sp. CCFEE 6253]
MATLKSLPTDAMIGIISHLDLKALMDFRQTCRWAEEEAFRRFATLKWERIHADESSFEPGRQVEKLLKVMEGRKQLAGFAKTLHIQLNTDDRHPLVFSVPPLHRRLYDAGDDVPTAAHLVAALPKLDRMTLQGVSSESFARHLKSLASPPPHGGSWLRLTVLHLDHIDILSHQLTSILRMAGRELIDLNLCFVAIEEPWQDLLGYMLSSLRGIKRVQFHQLQRPRLNEAKHRLELRSVPWRAFRKAMRGPQGIELADIRDHHWAHMYAGKPSGLACM